MRPTLAESLTEQFYAWERWGRGWATFPFRVVLEPPFRPFVRHLPARESVGDDGRQAPLWEIVWSWFRSKKKSGPRSEDPSPLDGLNFQVDDAQRELTELRIRLPADVAMNGELAESLLLAVACAGDGASFELIGSHSGLVLQFAVSTESADAVRRTVEAYVPGAVVADRATLGPAWDAARGGRALVVDFGLSQEFMLPLRTRPSLAVDPLLGFIAALEALRDREVGVLQVLLHPATAGWAASALRAMTDGEGHGFFADAPETLALTREKLSRPLLACVVRVAAKAPDSERAWAIARRLGSALSVLASPGSNELIPLSNDNYPDEAHEEDLLARRSCRTGMLLSSAELAGLVHLPAASVEAEDLRASARKTKAAPVGLLEGDVILGENGHKGRTHVVRLRTADRMRHLHLIGATGTGKSTLLLNLIRQDLEAGRGIALLDPHGDLADDVLALVPVSRASDVVLFDPADEEFPVGFNVLDAHSDRERDLLSSDLVGVFRRFSTSWGDQMSAVLGNAILAFLESPQGGSLLDLRRFLMSREVREKYLPSVSDPLVTSFWKEEFPRLSGRPQMPIVTRLDAFLRPRCIRNIVSQPKSRFDLGEIMDRGGIFIARLSQGAIGEQNAYLLGSLLVAKFQQAALARERMAEKDRRPFFLYLDEFHHFTTPSITGLLSGARKYRLGLVLAHQELRQLAEHDIRSAVLANAGTRVCFRVGDEDARGLASGFRSFDSQDLMSLGVGEAVCRVAQADQDFNLRFAPAPREDPSTRERRGEAIRSLSRLRYGRERSEVEALIAGSEPAAAPAPPPPAIVKPPPSRARPPPDISRPVPVTVPGAEAQAPSEPSRQRPPARRAPGKGGPEHKYLQSLIKSYAESKGFRATIEAPVEGGGNIDVLLQRDELKIACEVSVTTDAEHETSNVRKCLAAGASKVILVSPTAAGLKRLERCLSEVLTAEELGRLGFLTPTDLIAYLDEQGAPSAPEMSAVLGYKVKATVYSGAPGDRTRSQSVARTIMQAMRRLKEK